MKTRKWCKNRVTFGISFSLVIGIFSSMQMEAKADDSYSVDVTDQSAIEEAKERIYYPGDTLTFTNIPDSKTIIFTFNYHENSIYTGSMLKLGETISFPCDIEYGTLKGVGVVSSKYKYIDVYVNFYYSASPSESTTAPSHECNFQWVTTVEPQPGVDGLEEYKCVTCGMVKESQPIPASMATVKNLYGFIKDAPVNGTVTTDFGKLHTISDYLLKKMAERNDVTATIQFEYNNTKLQITFPAGTDYTPVLTDTDTMYGFYGVAAKLGLTVTEQQ